MIEVLKAGLYTTVQDMGRFGYRNAGVPLSGAMDRVSALRANLLLGNSKNDAVLEITMAGPTLKFQQNTTIAIAGASFEVLLNGAEIKTTQPISISKDDILQVGIAKDGMRCYLAVVGGIQTPLVLNSRSFYVTITKETRLKKGDVLPIEIVGKPAITEFTSRKLHTIDTKILEVYAGPEFKLLPELHQKALVTSDFKISAQSNRMAYVLESKVNFSATEILTAPVQPGVVQLTPSGKLLVLMRDAQVTGGYARIFQLTALSINLLSQKRGGECVALKLVHFSS